MKKFLFGITVFAVLSCFALNANSKELIREFNGSDSKATAEFEVKAPWIVDWRVRGDYPGQMAVHVELVSAPGGEYLGKVVTTKYVHNGVRLMNESGRFRFQVSATLAEWTLRVEQLTREEAKTYIPKDKIQ